MPLMEFLQQSFQYLIGSFIFILYIFILISQIIFISAYDEFGCPLSHSKAQVQAMEIVENSPTYQFDGKDLEYDRFLSNSEGSTCNWTFLFNFKSTHSGYGDRTGQELQESETSHVAYVKINDGELISATVDRSWDISNQEFGR